MIFWVVNFSHFVKNIFNQEYSVAKFHDFFPKKNRQNFFAYKYGRVLKFFYILSYFEHSRFWLNGLLSPLEQHYKFYLKKKIDSCVHNFFERAPSILYVPMFPVEIFLFYEMRMEGRKSKESLLPSFLIYC